VTDSPPPDATETRGAAGTLLDRLAAAEPADPRPLGGLIERLAAEGRLRTAKTAAAGETATRGETAADALLDELPIRGLALDSRHVEPGWLFVAVPGAHVDGHDFVAVAAQRGASAAIVERPVPGVSLPQIVVDGSQAALATAACWWYGDPSRELGVIGITGTDGKTTTSFLAAAMLRSTGISTGIVTTAGIRIGDLDSLNPEHVTTPDAPQLQRTLRAMVQAGDRAAIVETTSHGLALERVGGVAYDIAIFTNLTHEHLEFHGTFDAYRDAKLSLFRRLGRGPAKSLDRPWPSVAIINRDDPAAPMFEAAAAAAGVSSISYGESPSADVRATSIAEDARSLRFDVATPSWQGSLALQLAGRFNVHNALAAIALGEALELDPEDVRAGLAGVRGVPGRMERVDCGQPFGVVVDYAHSPASLEKVLDLLEPLAAARGGGVIAVFGSAGERDVQKRSMMGRAAARRCRHVIVTNEDPRDEDPQAILEQIAAAAEEGGLRRGVNLECIVDRKEAIAVAFERARPEDWVLLAGKGHERTIITRNGAEPWNERAAAVEALQSLGYRGE
jgi:UDP-N-acetylmuramoyl-L-alanyl-D-glutamate--2,6-diaminopimelate ligase